MQEKDNRVYFPAVLSKQRFNEFLSIKLKRMPIESGGTKLNKKQRDVLETMKRPAVLTFNIEAAQK